MKKFRAAICVILALSMVFAFCACSKAEPGTDKGSETASDSGSKPADAQNTPGSQDGQDTQSGQDAQSADSGSQGADAPEETKSADSQVIGADSSESKVHGTFEPNLEEAAAKPGSVQPGTVLNYASMDYPAQLPWNDTSAAFLFYEIYDSLLYQYQGNVNDIRGALAETWSHSDDYLTWTFNIRPGITFTDGTVCDAHAIEKCWQYYSQLSPTNLSNLNIASWEATEDLVFTVHLSNTCCNFEQSMTSSGLGIVSPTACELYGTDGNAAAIGTGPYYIDSYTAGVSIVLKAKENCPIPEKQACIETVNLVIIADDNTVVMAILNGEINGASMMDVQSYYTLQDYGYEGTILPMASNVEPLWMNAAKVEIFQNFDVRKSIPRFIDFVEVNDLVWDGYGLVQDSIWATGSSAYVPTDDYYYAPAEGLELLSGAGYSPSDINFTVRCYQGIDNYLVAIQGQLAESGVTIEVEVIEAAASFTYLMSGDWTLVNGSNGYTNESPLAPWGFILPQGAIIKQCFQDIYDPDLYEKMMNEYTSARSSMTWDEMISHVHQLTRYMQDDHAVIIGVQMPKFLVMDANVKNAVYFGADYVPQFYSMYIAD